MNTNAKVKESKGYEYLTTKHNLNTMSESVVFIREYGINSVKQLDEYIQKSVLKKDKVYKIKSKKLTRLCSYFLIQWNKFILLKSIVPNTKNIK